MISSNIPHGTARPWYPVPLVGNTSHRSYRTHIWRLRRITVRLPEVITKTHQDSRSLVIHLHRLQSILQSPRQCVTHALNHNILSVSWTHFSQLFVSYLSIIFIHITIYYHSREDDWLRKKYEMKQQNLVDNGDVIPIGLYSAHNTPISHYVYHPAPHLEKFRSILFLANCSVIDQEFTFYEFPNFSDLMNFKERVFLIPINS